MKKLYGIFIISFLLFTSCKNYQGAAFQANPVPLEVHADSVKFNLTASLPAKKIKKKDVVYEVVPTLGGFELGTLTVTGNNPGKKKKIDTVFQISVPYSSAMSNQFLTIKHHYLKGGEVIELPSVTDSAKCCLTTSQLLKDDFRLVMSEPEEKNVPLKLIAQFNFPLNKWQLDQKPLSEKDLELIRDFLNQKDTNTTVTISGSASPDGAFSRNQFLSAKRAEVVATWLKDALRAAGYSNYMDIVECVTIVKNAEDWAGFSILLDSAEISKEKQLKIREVLEQNLSAENTEHKISKIVGGSIYKLESILAPLRKTTLVIEARTELKRDTEIDSVAIAYVQKPDEIDLEEIFTREEWLYAVENLVDQRGKRTLLLGYYKTFPDDFKVFNDLGVLSLVQDTACPELVECKANNVLSGVKADGNYEFILEDKDYELKIKKEEDKYSYEEELPDQEIKVKKRGAELKYEKEGLSGEVKIKVEEGDVQVKTPEYDFLYEGPVDPDSISLNDKYQKEFSEALRFFEMADRLQPESAEPACNIACIYSLQGRYDGAEEYFMKSLKVKETPEAFYNLGLLKAKAGAYNEALEYLEKAEGIRGVEYTKALVNLLTYNTESARKLAESYLSQFPSDPMGHYLMAVIQARGENIAEACAELNLVCELNVGLCKRAVNDKELSSIVRNEGFKGIKSY